MGFLDRDRYDDLAKQLGATVVRDRKRPALAKNGVLVDFEEQFGDTSSSAIRRSLVRFHAELPSPGVPQFRLYPEGFQSFMSKLFGGEDVELGHRGIDLKFMVKATTPSVVQELWKPLCDRLDAMGELTVEGEDRKVVLEQPFSTMDLVMDPVPGIELLFALAEVDLYGRDVLRALPEAILHPELGEVWIPGPSPVRFGFIRSGERVQIKAEMDLEQPLTITDELTRKFEQLGATIGDGEKRVVLAWGERACNAERFLLAADRLRELSGGVPGDGVFR